MLYVHEELHKQREAQETESDPGHGTERNE